MAKRISELPAAGSAADADQIEANQSGTSRRVTRLQLLASAAPLVHTHTLSDITDLNSPSATTREAYQNNLGEVEETGTFAIAAATHYKREVKLQTSSASVTVQLPDPGDAQFTSIGEGHFCDLRVVSGTNEADVTATVTDTFRHASGYSAPDGDEDTIYLGYSRATAFGQIYALHRLDDIWVLYGPYRITETDDLALADLANLDEVDTAQIAARAVTPAKVEITAPIDINGRTLADADHNKQFRCTGTGTVTIPSSLTNGFICQLINRSAGSVTIAGSGLTPDGDLTLGDDHFATIAKDAATSALVRATG